jgi:hypothetical protein
MRDMFKRIVAASLWFYGAWTAAAVAAWLVGTPHELGPIVGLAAGLFVGLDPKHVIWPRAAHVPNREPVATQELVQA